MADSDLLAYYAARAAEYEKVYEKPERQRDLARLHAVIPSYFENRRVLEVACGTGYWTRRIAPLVSSIVACDLTTETLAVAQANQPDHPNVSFIAADAYHLAAVPGAFDSAFAGFWWSHVRYADLGRFLAGLHQRLEPKSLVVFVDNRYVEGSNWPITHTDAEGNTFQRRRLENGAEHDVLKNFPTSAQVQDVIERSGGRDFAMLELEHYWCATYRT
jgi:demethylmenaquinone methyltransferase/2-methoxy-6-polyprenyl-1,4-benzoquinol methylase